MPGVRGSEGVNIQRGSMRGLSGDDGAGFFFPHSGCGDDMYQNS